MAFSPQVVPRVFTITSSIAESLSCVPTGSGVSSVLLEGVHDKAVVAGNDDALLSESNANAGDISG